LSSYSAINKSKYTLCCWVSSLIAAIMFSISLTLCFKFPP
jgi:hypothetical protein